MQSLLAVITEIKLLSLTSLQACLAIASGIMQLSGWSRTHLRAAVASDEAAAVFFRSAAPVEAYRDCFYASAGIVSRPPRQGRLVAFCRSSCLSPCAAISCCLSGLYVAVHPSCATYCRQDSDAAVRRQALPGAHLERFVPQTALSAINSLPCLVLCHVSPITRSVCLQGSSCSSI